MFCFSNQILSLNNIFLFFILMNVINNIKLSENVIYMEQFRKNRRVIFLRFCSTQKNFPLSGKIQQNNENTKK